MSETDTTTAEAPVIPGFHVEQLLGEGAFGRVWLAHETEGLRRTVALKVFHAERLDAWRRELEASARVEDLRRGSRELTIVQALGSGEHEGRGWLALEYVEQGSLKDLVERDGPLSLDQALPAIRDAGTAIQCLHEAGIFHRDVKPANLLLGGDGRVRLGDFGLTRELEGSLSAAGSPAFAPPEQIAGCVRDDERTRVDIYSLGATLSWLLTGVAARPGRPDAFELERRGVPRSLQRVILAAMAYEPEERPASVGALIQDLGSAAPAGGAREAENRQGADSSRKIVRTSSEAPEEPVNAGENEAGERSSGDMRFDDETMTGLKTGFKTGFETGSMKAALVSGPPAADGIVRQPTCLICQEPVFGSERRRACMECLSWHHASCWHEDAPCAACGFREDDREPFRTSAPAHRPAHSPASPRRRSGVGRWIAGGLAGVLGLALVLSAMVFLLAVSERRPVPPHPLRAPRAPRGLASSFEPPHSYPVIDVRVKAGPEGTVVSWKPSPKNHMIEVMGYKILRKIGKGTRRKVAELGPEERMWIDPEVRTGTAATYRIVSQVRLDPDHPRVRAELQAGGNPRRDPRFRIRGTD